MISTKDLYSEINLLEDIVKKEAGSIDGAKLNIMSVHKTLNDYVQAIHEAGFQIEDIREVGVTEEHLETNPDFFKTVQDRPLHLIFKLRKPQQ